MHPYSLEDRLVYMKNEDGTYTVIGPVEEAITMVAPDYADNPANKLFRENMWEPSELVFTFGCNMSKGERDCILGWTWTPAAQRYKRRCKRKKEKLRRQKLKETIEHEPV